MLELRRRRRFPAGYTWSPLLVPTLWELAAAPTRNAAGRGWPPERAIALGRIWEAMRVATVRDAPSLAAWLSRHSSTAVAPGAYIAAVAQEAFVAAFDPASALQAECLAFVASAGPSPAAPDDSPHSSAAEGNGVDTDADDTLGCAVCLMHTREPELWPRCHHPFHPACLAEVRLFPSGARCPLCRRGPSDPVPAAAASHGAPADTTAHPRRAASAEVPRPPGLGARDSATHGTTGGRWEGGLTEPAPPAWFCNDPDGPAPLECPLGSRARWRTSSAPPLCWATSSLSATNGRTPSASSQRPTATAPLRPSALPRPRTGQSSQSTCARRMRRPCWITLTGPRTAFRFGSCAQFARSRPTASAPRRSWPTRRALGAPACCNNARPHAHVLGLRAACGGAPQRLVDSPWLRVRGAARATSVWLAAAGASAEMLRGALLREQHAGMGAWHTRRYRPGHPAHRASECPDVLLHHVSAPPNALVRVQAAIDALADPAIASWTADHVDGAMARVVSPGAIPAVFDAWSRCTLDHRPRLMLVGGVAALGDLDPALVWQR